MNKTWLDKLGEDAIVVVFPGKSEDDRTIITLFVDEGSCHCERGRILGDMIVHVKSPGAETISTMSIIEGESEYDAVLKAVQLVKNHLDAE